jgi:predicted O-methyltransferase YrrM
MFEHFYCKKVDVTVNELMQTWIGQPNLSFLEIGSAEGSSAIGIIETVLTHASSKLTCVDKWDAAFSNGFFADDFESNFDANTQSHASKIVKVKSDSVTWLIANQDKRFDFIYIDGDHTYSGCKMDITLSWNTLKSGCWMVIDDYGFEGVTQATDEFTISAQGIAQMVRTPTQTWFKKA